MATTTIWIVRTVVLVSSWPALAAAPNQFGNAITVSIYDLAHIGSKTLGEAEVLVTRIFEVAGINTRWTTGPPSIPKDLASDFRAVTGSECAKPLHSAVVRIQILSHAPNGFAPQALGYSLPCAERGMQVTIYADRAEEVSRRSLAAFYRVLAYTLTHELGHVILRSSAHEKSGLMKGVWSKSDWQRAAVAIVPFTPDQGRRMAQWLHRIESPDLLIGKSKSHAPS